MRRLFKIFIIVVVVSGLAGKSFAQESLPNWATAYADDALIERIQGINNEILSLLGSLRDKPAKLDKVMWSNPQKLNAFKTNPNIIACVVTSSSGITYMFLNENYKYLDSSSIYNYDDILAHELLHLYTGHDIDHGDLWQVLADYISRNSRFNITEVYQL